MTVSIVDSLEMVQIDQRQAMLPSGPHVLQLACGQAQEMPAVEQPGEFVGGHQVLQLPHHPAQGVLVRLQGETTLTHPLAHRLHVAGEQAQPDQQDEQHPDLQPGHARVHQQHAVGLDQHHRGEAEEGEQRAAHEHPGRQLEHTEQQDQHVEDHEDATRGVEEGQYRWLPGQRHQHLGLGQAGVVETQVAPGQKQPEKHQLAAHDAQGQPGRGRYGTDEEAVEHGKPTDERHHHVRAEGHGEAFEQQALQAALRSPRSAWAHGLRPIMAYRLTLPL